MILLDGSENLCGKADAIFLFFANVVDMGKDSIRAILVDVKREKTYAKSGMTDFLVTEDTDLLLEADFDTKEITKKVFAEFKSNSIILAPVRSPLF